MEITKHIEFIIDNIGGVENILQVEHCATRIRVKLSNYSKINQLAINEYSFIKASFISNGVYQLVMDSDVIGNVYCSIKSILDHVNNENISLHTFSVSLVRKLGGQDNINSIEYCSTRLRISVHHPELVDKSEDFDLEMIKGIYLNKKLCQVVLDPGLVKPVYENLSQLIDSPVLSENRKYFNLKDMVKKISRKN